MGIFCLYPKTHPHWPPRSSGESSHGVRRRHSRGGFVVNALVVAAKRLRRLFTSQWCSGRRGGHVSSSENAPSAAAQRAHHDRHRCAQCPATAGPRTVIGGDPRRIYRAHRVVFSRLGRAQYAQRGRCCAHPRWHSQNRGRWHRRHLDRRVV